MSWRRFGVVLRHLLADTTSAYFTAVRNTIEPDALAPPTPGIFGPWPQTDMLLAQIVDLIQIQMWQRADPKSAGPAPKPYPRPGVEAKVRPISPAAAAYLEYKRTHQGADPPEDWEPAL